MEVGVYYKDEGIEKFRFPELAGKTVSTLNELMNREQSICDLDDVLVIREKFYQATDGSFFMSQTAVKPNDRSSEFESRFDVPNHISRSFCVVPCERVDDVNRILVDGEQVYPELADVTIDEIDFECEL